jgi:hypothetical protein
MIQAEAASCKLIQKDSKKKVKKKKKKSRITFAGLQLRSTDKKIKNKKRNTNEQRDQICINYQNTT